MFSIGYVKCEAWMEYQLDKRRVCVSIRQKTSVCIN